MIDHLHQLAIHAYYAGEIDTGRRACERLLSQSLPADLERQTRANRTWYTPTISDLVRPVLFVPITVPPAHEGWSLFNPTILATDAGLIGIVRSSNYRIDDAGRYVMPEGDDGRIRTENLLVRFDGLVVTDSQAIVEPDYARNGYPVHGFEDCRLRQTQTGIGVSATVRDAAGWDGRCRIATASLGLDTATLSRMRVLEWDGLQPHEKNWMPIAGRDGWLYAASHGGQTVTVQAEPDMPGVYEVRGHGPAPHIAGGFRGGGQLVPLRDGWLGIVHEVAVMDSGRRAYEHRFVWFDADFRLARMSPLFAIRESRSIEFAAGLAIVGQEVVVSFGVRDAEAWLVSLSLDDVCQLLAPVS